MKLKRLYKDGKIAGIKFISGGPCQNFSPHFVEGGIEEGWLKMENHKIILESDPPIIYSIIREPGKYPDDSIAGYHVDNFYACVRKV